MTVGEVLFIAQLGRITMEIGRVALHYRRVSYSQGIELNPEFQD